MGTILKGILGGFSGLVGTVIGSNWKGIQCMKSRPPKRSTSSPAQLQQQAKFGMMIKFLRIFRDLLKTSFNEFADEKSGPNAALSVNMLHAITGDYPAFTINYPMLLLSHGNLKKPQAPKAIAGTTGKVEFSWINNAGNSKSDATDNAILVIYDPSTQNVVYKLDAAQRTLGSDTLDVAEFSGLTVETWMAFVSA